MSFVPVWPYLFAFLSILPSSVAYLADPYLESVKETQGIKPESFEKYKIKTIAIKKDDESLDENNRV